MKRDDQFGDRIRRCRKRAGLSQRRLAEATGVSVNAVQSYEKGTMPNGANLVELSKALSCSIDWLLTGNRNPADDSTDDSIAPLSAGVRIPRISPDSVARRLFVVVSKDPDAENDAEDTEAADPFLGIDREWLRRAASAPENVVLMTVTGDSMETTLRAGDYVLYDRGRRQIHDGCIYAVQVGDGVSFKRLERLLNGNIRVVSDNREVSPAYEALPEEVVVLGRVIWLGRRL